MATISDSALAIVTSLKYFGVEVSLFITPQLCAWFIIIAPSLRLHGANIKLLILKVGKLMRPIFVLKVVGSICIVLLTVAV